MQGHPRGSEDCGNVLVELNTARSRPSEGMEENPWIHGREGGRREKTKLNEALTLSHKGVGAEEVAPERLQVFGFRF